jgi:predicted nuclease of predicted toxin-antitoxin system
MRFLVDECTGPSVARWLREQGYDVFSVYEQARGLDDASVMALAVREGRILITSDKEFGTRVVRDRQPHRVFCCCVYAMSGLRTSFGCLRRCCAIMGISWWGIWWWCRRGVFGLCRCTRVLRAKNERFGY